MIKKIILLLVLLFVGCDSIPVPVVTNVLDPESTEYPQRVGPKNFYVETLDVSTIKFGWNYYSYNKDADFEVVLSNNKNEIINTFKTNKNYLEITNLDTAQSYTLKARVLLSDLNPKFSEPEGIYFSKSVKKIATSDTLNQYNNINYASYSPNGLYFAFSDGSNIIIRSSEINIGHENKINSGSSKFFFTKDDKYFIVANSNSQLDLWKAGKILVWKFVKSITTLNIEFYSTSNKDEIIAISDSKKINILNIPDGNIIKEIPGFNNISALKFSNDGNLLVVGSSDKKISLIDCKTWKVTKVLNVDDAIENLDISIDNKLLLYTSGKNLIVINQNSGSVEKKYSSSIDKKINGALFANNLNDILVATGSIVFLLDREVEIKLFNSQTEIKDIDKNKDNNKFICTGKPLVLFNLKNISINGEWVINGQLIDKE